MDAAAGTVNIYPAFEILFLAASAGTVNAAAAAAAAAAGTVNIYPAFEILFLAAAGTVNAAAAAAAVAAAAVYTAALRILDFAAEIVVGAAAAVCVEVATDVDKFVGCV